MLLAYQHEQLAMPLLSSTFLSQLTVPTELDAFSAAVGSAGVNVAVDIDSLLPNDRCHDMTIFSFLS